MELYKFTNGTTADADEVNINFDDSLLIGHAARVDQLRLMQDAGLAEQGDNPTNTERDIFTDANGYNNTIDSGSATAAYDSTNKCYNASPGSDEAPADTLHNPDGWTNPTRAFDGNDATAANYTYSYSGTQTKVLGKTFAQKTILWYRASMRVSGDTGNVTVNLEWYNGSTWTILTQVYTSDGPISYPDISGVVNQTCQGLRLAFVKTNNGATKGHYIYSFEYGSSLVAGNVPTNALSSSGNNINAIFVWGQKEDDGTNLITYDASSDNGANWTTGLSFDTINKLTSTLGNQLLVRFQIPADADAKLYGYSLNWGRV